MAQLSNEDKAKIYSDLQENESIKNLCRRHNIRPHYIYEWIKSNKKSAREAEKGSRAFQSMDVISSMNGFASIRKGSIEIILQQEVTAQYLKELLSC